MGTFTIFNGPESTLTHYGNFEDYSTNAPYNWGGIPTMRYWMDGCPGNGWTSLEFEHRFDDETGLWIDMWTVEGVPYVSVSYTPESWTLGNNFHLGLSNGPEHEATIQVKDFCYKN